MISYSPIIKSRGFDPSPVANGRIPDFANSTLYPGVLGTIAHEDWWDEQIDRCINGYTTGGIFIPGRYYYYLNFCLLLTLGRGYHYPDYVDLDLELFRLIDTAKKERKGIIVPKKRRAGVSHKFVSVISHGVMFTPGGYKAGIVAGLDVYSKGFYDKFKEDNDRKPPEFRLHTLASNQDEWKAGYEIKTNNSFKKDGSFNTVFCRTANMNENVFKGEILNDCGFEEGGEFNRLEKTFGATKACFMKGMEMRGTPYVWATGGKMASSRDFKNMYAESLRGNNQLIPMPIYGNRLVIGFFIGSTDDDGDVKENCPNIMKEYGHLSKEQILGCEDVVAADQEIMRMTMKLQGAVDRQLLYDHYQDFPSNDREMFLNFSGNNFSVENISKQSYEISLLMEPKYGKYNFDYEKINGKENREKVIRRPATQHEIDNHLYVMCTEDALPEGYSNYDVAGIDSYDQDQSKKSKSLGAMVVVRRQDRNTRHECSRPIALVRMRPIRKEIFYETCLKVAIYYNLKRNVLIDVAKFLVGEYFIKNGGTKYLAERPKSFESKDSDQQHMYGVALTLRSKPKMVAGLETWVLDFIDECWFPMIIAELSDYDVHQADSDWDAADALGIALMRISDMRARPESDDDAEEGGAISSPVWKKVNGVMVDQNRTESEKIRDANCFNDSMEIEGDPNNPPSQNSGQKFRVGDY